MKTFRASSGLRSCPDIRQSSARVLSSFPALQIGQDFHVAAKARRAAGQVLADEGIRLGRTLGQANQVPIGRTVDPVGIWKRFGKIRLGEGEELFLVDVLSLFVAHWFARLFAQIAPAGLACQRCS
jgi:hypothetical protein